MVISLLSFALIAAQGSSPPVIDPTIADVPSLDVTAEAIPGSSRRTSSKRVTLGRKRFAKISAIEGIHLSAEVRQDFLDFDRKGLSPDDRRQAINKKYGKKPT